MGCVFSFHKPSIDTVYSLFISPAQPAPLLAKRPVCAVSEEALLQGEADASFDCDEDEDFGHPIHSAVCTVTADSQQIDPQDEALVRLYQRTVEEQAIKGLERPQSTFAEIVEFPKKEEFTEQ